MKTIKLAVTKDRKLYLSEACLGYEGEHNATTLEIVQPKELDQYNCQIEFKLMKQGSVHLKKPYDITDGTFTLTNALTIKGNHKLQLVYTDDGGYVKAKTNSVGFSIAESICAVDTINNSQSYIELPEVSENEIYLNLLLSPDAANYVAFAVMCEEYIPYTVEYGAVENGVFTAVGSETVESGETYQGTFYYDDWGNEAGGKRQVILHITGTAISYFYPSCHTARNFFDFYAWDVFEFKGNLPSCTYLYVGGYMAQSALRIKRFTLEGTNNLQDVNGIFGNCNLESFSIDTSNWRYFSSMFRGSTIVNGPEFDLSSARAFDAFTECYFVENFKVKNINADNPPYIVLYYLNLSAEFMVELFESLPTITTEASIHIYSTPAAMTMTSDQYAIATAKGWTVST